MSTPLVTVICLCFNHENYVLDSIRSVLNQTYQNIQLIIIDDASTDGSVSVIENFLKTNPDIQFIKQVENTGNCKAFNHTLKFAKGEYIIDLAADDILLPNRIEQGVKTFESHDTDYGINFSDAAYINEKSEVIKHHYTRDSGGRLTTIIPQGNVFIEVLQSYFICSPTTMIKKVVLDELNGYDESLNYEDFDLWVRASRSWKFCYTDKVLVQKRVLSKSHGHQQYKRGNKQMESTYQVCLKAFKLCENKDEHEALRIRMKYELKHAMWLVKPSLTFKYLSLWIKSVRASR